MDDTNSTTIPIPPPTGVKESTECKPYWILRDNREVGWQEMQQIIWQKNAELQNAVKNKGGVEAIPNMPMMPSMPSPESGPEKGMERSVEKQKQQENIVDAPLGADGERVKFEGEVLSVFNYQGTSYSY